MQVKEIGFYPESTGESPEMVCVCVCVKILIKFNMLTIFSV